MTKRNLLEAATLVSESASEDGTWKVKLISEGKGSSGTYTASLLENHHHAFDEVLSFRNHPTGWDGPETRDFTMIAGEIVGQTWVENDERGLKAVYGNYLPDPEYRDKIERYKKKLGLSIYIEGSGYVDENSGEFIVDWFNPEDPYASIDVVIAPGARGAFMESLKKTYDSRRSESAEATATAAEEMERNKMELDKKVESLEAKIDALATQMSTLVTAKETEAAESAQAEADAKAVEAAVAAYDAAVKAVEEADLLKPQKDALLEQARKGEDISAAIESAKAIKEAAVEAARVTESAPGREFGARKVESATDLGKVFG